MTGLHTCVETCMHMNVAAVSVGIWPCPCFDCSQQYAQHQSNARAMIQCAGHIERAGHSTVCAAPCASDGCQPRSAAAAAAATAAAAIHGAAAAVYCKPCCRCVRHTLLRVSRHYCHHACTSTLVNHVDKALPKISAPMTTPMTFSLYPPPILATQAQHTYHT